MIIFTALAFGAFILVAGSFLFGHDTDHDADAGHDVGGGEEATVSIFSTKVLGTMIMGFGAAGAIATHYGATDLIASLIGVLCGVLLAAIVYGILEIFYTQQSSSLVPTSSAVGCSGSVTVSIADGLPGEVGLYLEGQYRTFSATSGDGKPIPKGQTVQVVRTLGSHLVVEKET